MGDDFDLFYDDWDFYNDWNDEKDNSDLINKYSVEFDLVKDKFYAIAKKIINEKWKFSDKVTDMLIPVCLASFKTNIVNGNSYLRTDEDVMEYYSSIVDFYCKSKDQEILQMLSYL